MNNDRLSRIINVGGCVVVLSILLCSCAIKVGLIDVH